MPWLLYVQRNNVFLKHVKRRTNENAHSLFKLPGLESGRRGPAGRSGGVARAGVRVGALVLGGVGISGG
jgi:hypothetical protein